MCFYICKSHLRYTICTFPAKTYVLKKQKIHSRWYTTLATKGNTWKYNTPWQRKYSLVLYFWESQVQSWARVTVCADLHMFALWLHGFPQFSLVFFYLVMLNCPTGVNMCMNMCVHGALPSHLGWVVPKMVVPNLDEDKVVASYCINKFLKV